jgi:O-succinylbenzoate synthase
MHDYPFPGSLLEQETINAIDHIHLVVIKIPFIKPFGTSVATWAEKEALLLKIEAGGLTAWGECVADPDPYYSYETTSTAHHIIRDFLVPLILPDITLPELERRFHRIRGHCMARAAVENALLDLIAQRKSIPLHTLLGWPRKKIMSGISIGLQESKEELMEEVEEAVEKKYHRVKMKIARGKDIEWIGAVRERFPGCRLMADANGDYSIEESEHLKKLDAFNLMMIEQPLSYDDIYRHSILQKSLQTPLCLDESIHSLEDARAAIELGSCRIINIKQGRVGGLMEAVRIARYCHGKGISTWSGGMDETGIGRAVNIHLQTVEGFDLPGDTSETSRYFQEDLVDPPVILDRDGFIDVPGGPGTGVTVLPDRIKKFTVSSERLF